MRAAISVCAATFCAVLLAGCAMQYMRKVPGWNNFGYSEMKIDETTYQVRYDGNGVNSKELVANYWLYRCAELTKEKGYELFALAFPSAADSSSRIDFSGALRPAVLSPGGKRLRGRPMAANGHLVRTYMIFIPGGTITTWHSRAVLRMYHEPLPSEVPFAFRAQVILDGLQAYVTSSGKAAAPDREALSKAALVANPAYHWPLAGHRPGVPLPGSPAPILPARPPPSERKPAAPDNSGHLSPTGRSRLQSPPAYHPRLV